MRIVLADSNPAAIEVFYGHQLTSLLFSFWYAYEQRKSSWVRAYKAMTAVEKTSKLYIDSGVFSARKHNVSIPTEKLIEFYETHSDVIDHVFSMDEGTKEEQLEKAIQMKKAGVPVIPIYHGNMSLDYIDRMLEINGYIAISFWAMGRNRSYKAFVKYLNPIFDYIHKRNLWPCKLHALGIERFDVLSQFPFFSADSTSAVSDYAFGRAAKFDNIDLKMKSARFGIEGQRDKAIEYGGTEAGTLARKDMPGITARRRQSQVERYKLQKTLTELWTKRGVIFND